MEWSYCHYSWLFGVIILSEKVTVFCLGLFQIVLNFFSDAITHPWAIFNGPLTRYVKLRVAHAPGIPGTFSSPPSSKVTASKRSLHASWHVRYARTMMHVGIASSRWRRKGSQHSRRMRNPQFYTSGKRPIWLNWTAFEITRFRSNHVLCFSLNTVIYSYPRFNAD